MFNFYYSAFGITYLTLAGVLFPIIAIFLFYTCNQSINAKIDVWEMKERISDLVDKSRTFQNGIKGRLVGVDPDDVDVEKAFSEGIDFDEPGTLEGWNWADDLIHETLAGSVDFTTSPVSLVDVLNEINFRRRYLARYEHPWNEGVYEKVLCINKEVSNLANDVLFGSPDNLKQSLVRVGAAALLLLEEMGEVRGQQVLEHRPVLN